MVVLEWDYSKYDSQFDEWNSKGVYPGHFDFNAATNYGDLAKNDNVAYANIYTRHCCIGKITRKGEAWQWAC